MGELTNLGIKYNTDKATYHEFTDFYEKYFTDFKSRNNNILEIGVYNGSSLKMLREYFQNSKIYGIDIFDKSEYNEERIETYICNQVDTKGLDDIFNSKKFDIVIDDGGHTMSQQQISFKHLIKKMNTSGIYIIEDLHTSLNLGDNEHYQVGKSTLDLVNSIKNGIEFYSNYISEKEYEDICNKVDFIDIFEIKKENEFGKSITSVVKIK